MADGILDYLRSIGVINQDTLLTPSFRDGEGNVSSTPSTPNRTTVTGNRNPFQNAETAGPSQRATEIASMKALNDYKQPYQINKANTPLGLENAGPMKPLNYRQAEINSMNALGNMANQNRTVTPSTTTGRVSASAAAPTQAQIPSNQVYYMDRGDGGPLVPMGNQLPKGMSPGSQQGGGYIFGVDAPTKSLFGSNPKTDLSQYPKADVPTPPARPDNLQADDGMASGGSINRASKVAREKATPCHSGIINMAVGGRTDHIPMNVLEGSYVLPADIVSGLGEGNTLAGAKILDNMFNMGPMNQKMPGFRASPRVPANISPQPKLSLYGPPQYQADGGRTMSMAGKPVPIIAAGGEYVVHPDTVAKMGGGDLDKGHNYFDNFVKYVRSHTAKTLQKLPGPRKD
jgi:hypothetical protein